MLPESEEISRILLTKARAGLTITPAQVEGVASAYPLWLLHDAPAEDVPTTRYWPCLNPRAAL